MGVSCCACGADAEVAGVTVTGFVPFTADTVEYGPVRRDICDACLRTLLAEVLSRAGRFGASALALAAVRGERR